MEAHKQQETEVITELRLLMGERLTTAPAACEQHGRDESYHTPRAADAVVFPRSTEEVAKIVALCASHRTPVIPFGAGTSLEGHIAALHGGVCIDLSRMNGVLEVNAEDMDATVQAGVTRKQINRYLHDTGLFFPVDPGADATLGGMAATRASGTNAVRYGTMRENVLAMTVVLADGRITHTGGRARKSSAGYDLTRLFIGSEGTLGVITELTVRLYGNPEAVASAVCTFPKLSDAVQTTIQAIQYGVPVARIELLDEAQIRAVNRYSGLECREAPTLFFEFHGSEASVAEQAAKVQEIAADFGAQDFRWATDETERRRLWQARHDAYYAALAQFPGARGFVTDVCVPISRLADCIGETKIDLDGADVRACIVGHVGDGNFHVIFCVDPERAEEIDTVKRLNDRMVSRALAMGGTCTGEHGIGYGKMDFLDREHGDSISVMRNIKLALDPANLMNPGKIVRV